MSVSPPKSVPVKLLARRHAWPARKLYAVMASSRACIATASVWCTVPITIPGGKPVIEEPGYKPKSPVITDGPVLVTVEEPRTAKLCDVPSVGATCADRVWHKAVKSSSATPATGKNDRISGKRIFLIPPLGGVRLSSPTPILPRTFGESRRVGGHLRRVPPMHRLPAPLERAL